MEILDSIKTLPVEGKVLLALCAAMAMLVAMWCIISLTRDKDDPKGSDDDFWSL